MIKAVNLTKSLAISQHYQQSTAQFPKAVYTGLSAQTAQVNQLLFGSWPAYIALTQEPLLLMTNQFMKTPR
jgi:hypothetical protein